MNYRKPKQRSELEVGHVERLRKLMHREGWHTKKTHGSMFSEGWPDLYCTHQLHGPKWVEVKTDEGKLEDSQIELFTQWARSGTNVWVLRDERDYALLFRDPNWWIFSLPKNQRSMLL